jgi:BlaI family transcriptional regulator, penicillinase repressor
VDYIFNPMKKVPKITETEWEIMRVVWAEHPVTATQIIERLTGGERRWHPKTTRALLNRLVQKGILDYEPRGRVHVYEPLFTEQECVAAASESFLARVFGGSLQPMLAFFVERQRITKEDLKQLSDLLEGKEGKKPSKKKG